MDKKQKRIVDLTNDNRRQHKLIVEKTKECQKWREEVEANRGKVQERDKIVAKNRELI